MWLFIESNRSILSISWTFHLIIFSIISKKNFWTWFCQMSFSQNLWCESSESVDKWWIFSTWKKLNLHHSFRTCANGVLASSVLNVVIFLLCVHPYTGFHYRFLLKNVYFECTFLFRSKCSFCGPRAHWFPFHLAFLQQPKTDLVFQGVFSLKTLVSILDFQYRMIFYNLQIWVIANFYGANCEIKHDQILQQLVT